MDREQLARRLYEAWASHGSAPASAADWDHIPNRAQWRLVADAALNHTHRETLERVEHDLRLVNAKLELLHGLVERKREHAT